MNIGVFTYITGLATLLGLFLQLRDVFPQHKEARKATVLVVFGLFIGTIVGSLQKVSVNLDVPLDGFSLLTAAFVGILAIVVVSAVFTGDPHRRRELFTACGIGVFALMLFLTFGYMFTHSNTISENQMNALTIDELIFLSDSSARSGDHSRSIQWLEKVNSRLDKSDQRKEIILQRINEAKTKQVTK